MCKYCDYENATLPWFETINDADCAYDGISVNEDGVPSLYLFNEDYKGDYEEIETPIAYCPFCGRKL